jgi:hypothetical protein
MGLLELGYYVLFRFPHHPSYDTSETINPLYLLYIHLDFLYTSEGGGYIY